MRPPPPRRLAVPLLALAALAAALARATPEAATGPPAGGWKAARAKLLDRLGVSAWHRLGRRGAGVTVAVLDSGFHGYREHLGGCLPGRVRARSFRRDGDLEARDSQHGVLCGEVIHALAPEAELLFVNWEPDRPDTFLDAVRWARAEGARVLSCSVIMPLWSDGEGGGAVHRELSALLDRGGRAGDALLFASAGNTAQRHWAGEAAPDSKGWHQWRPGVTENTLRPWGDEPVSVELCAAPGAAYELVVSDATAGRDLPARALPGADGRGWAVRFEPQPAHSYTVRLRPRGQGGRFHLVALGAGLEHATRRGSIPFPADGVEAVAVGAVDEAGRRLGYSSCGPTAAGPKPDFVATVPFASSWRARPFSGTSAAAPQAAALAALLLSAHPDWPAARARAELRAAAGGKGVEHDLDTGFGPIRLP
jgi:hypothetical protein